ncbi:hypothetical protein B0I35DRAFT_483055 [Stachybotrys elegans]|uniref:Uncharacterized protein n=1 Tax=Stachybotrys elegans TaxID=80388 RepID=A0A8K0SL14_9HYPO|nr:hypothetical protein B0I35DRAFT_483055 [Stachybotrys elegans]
MARKRHARRNSRQPGQASSDTAASRTPGVGRSVEATAPMAEKKMKEERGRIPREQGNNTLAGSRRTRSVSDTQTRSAKRVHVESSSKVPSETLEPTLETSATKQPIVGLDEKPDDAEITTGDQTIPIVYVDGTRLPGYDFELWQSCFSEIVGTPVELIEEAFGDLNYRVDCLVGDLERKAKQWEDLTRPAQMKFEAWADNAGKHLNSSMSQGGVFRAWVWRILYDNILSPSCVAKWNRDWLAFVRLRDDFRGIVTREPFLAYQFHQCKLTTAKLFSCRSAAS